MAMMTAEQNRIESNNEVKHQIAFFMNYQPQLAMRLSHLKAIANTIETNAPDVPMRETRRNYFEGEREFTVSYNDIELDCVHRMAIIDTSNLDYHNGTGYSEEVVYDEIAVLNAFNALTEESLDELVDELNGVLC